MPPCQRAKYYDSLGILAKPNETLEDYLARAETFHNTMHSVTQDLERDPRSIARYARVRRPKHIRLLKGSLEKCLIPDTFPVLELDDNSFLQLYYDSVFYKIMASLSSESDLIRGVCRALKYHKNKKERFPMCAIRASYWKKEFIKKHEIVHAARYPFRYSDSPRLEEFLADLLAGESWLGIEGTDNFYIDGAKREIKPPSLSMLLMQGYVESFFFVLDYVRHKFIDKEELPYKEKFFPGLKKVLRNVKKGRCGKSIQSFIWALRQFEKGFGDNYKAIVMRLTTGEILSFADEAQKTGHSLAELFQLKAEDPKFGWRFELILDKVRKQ